jgi:hypothetical protein
MDALTIEIDSTPSQREHLAEPKAAVPAEKNERAVARVDRRSKFPEVVVGDESHFLTFDFRYRQCSDRVVLDKAILNRGGDTLVQSLNNFLNGRRSEVAALRRAQGLRPRSEAGAIEHHQCGGAEVGENMRPEVLVVPRSR